MDFKRFASHGSENPLSNQSVKRSLREYPLKRNSYGKKREMAKKMKPQK